MTRPNPILLDCDGVLGDFLGLVDEVAHKAGMHFDPKKAIGEEIFSQFGSNKELVIRQLNLYGAASRIRPMEGAVDAVKELKGLGLDVVVLTSPWLPSPTWDYERRAWLELHFSIPAKDVIFARRKDLVPGAVLVEDSLRNATSWATTNGRKSLLMYSPLTDGVEVPAQVARVRDWEECLAEIKVLGKRGLLPNPYDLPSEG